MGPNSEAEVAAGTTRSTEIDVKGGRRDLCQVRDKEAKFQLTSR